MRDAIAQVATFARQGDGPGGIDVEPRTEADELSDGVRALGDEHAHGLLVAQPHTGHEGVVQVLVR